MGRATMFAVGAAAAVAVAAVVISSSHAIGRRANESVSSEDVGWGRVDVHSPTGWSPPPCPPCWVPSTETENFDNVTPPELPAGWLATNALGPSPLWVTSDSGVPTPPADTPPNAAFIDDPAVVSDKRLDAFSLDTFETSAQLIFRQNFNLEASDVDPNLGYDGGVLELSTDGGNTFQDIVAAGGFFIMGGYNRTISTDRGSPIAGRQAWSGNSGGFITTVVDLPGGATNVKLRWRMASDSTGSGDGWRVDTVEGAMCHGKGTPCPTASPTPSATITPTPTVTPTPAETCTAYGLACGAVLFSPPTEFDVAVSCPIGFGGCGGFTVNNIPADSCTSDVTGVFYFFNTSPVVPGLNTMHLEAGAFHCDFFICSDTPVAEFTCTFLYKGSTVTPSPTATPRIIPTPRVRPTPRPRP